MDSRTTNWHPSDADIDAARSGEADDAAAHIAECEVCQGRLAELNLLAAELAQPIGLAPIPDAQAAAIMELSARTSREITGRRRRLWMVPAVAAAAAALVFLVWSPGEPSPTTQVSNQAIHPHDVNEDGQVDILDALSLARTVDSAGPTRDSWDFNGDRVVDDADIAWLGQTVVKTSGESL